jgi:hypothetical protein
MDTGSKSAIGTIERSKLPFAGLSCPGSAFICVDLWLFNCMRLDDLNTPGRILPRELKVMPVLSRQSGATIRARRHGVGAANFAIL